MDALTAVVAQLSAQMALQRQSVAIAAVKQANDVQQSMIEMISEAAVVPETYNASGSVSGGVEAGSLLNVQA